MVSKGCGWKLAGLDQNLDGRFQERCENGGVNGPDWSRMFRIASIRQPSDSRIVDHLRSAMVDPRFNRLEAAVAYATLGGVEDLQLGGSGQIRHISRQWLSSIDWCRSEPTALTALDQLPKSEVRIFDGLRVVDRRGCSPRVSFHPKGFVFSGPRVRLLISGSGNLSRNGVSKGVELNTVVEVSDPKTRAEKSLWQSIEAIRAWHNSMWQSAAAYKTLDSRYRETYKRSFASPPKTDDDTFDVDDVGNRRGYSAEDLVKIRRAMTFWIEGGNLTENLGRGDPGNQLMMRGLTRVFFGFDGTRVPRRPTLGRSLSGMAEPLHGVCRWSSPTTAWIG